MLRRQAIHANIDTAAHVNNLKKESVDTPKSYPRKSIRANAGPSLYVARLEQRLRQQEERIIQLEQWVANHSKKYI